MTPPPSHRCAVYSEGFLARPASIDDARLALAETIALQHGAIALATEYGVQQNLLSEIAGLTPARLSQIVAATKVPDTSREAFCSQTREALALRPLTFGNAQAHEDGPDKFELMQR